MHLVFIKDTVAFFAIIAIAVCILPRSQASRCASHRGVSNLPNVCFDPKFYECYFSVMPEDITDTIQYTDTVSHKLFKEYFLLQTFFDKT